MAESNGKGCLVGIGVFGSVVALFLGVGLLDDPPKKEAAAAGGCEVARVGGGGSLEAGKVPNGWGPKVEDAGKEAGTPSGLSLIHI